MDNFIPAFFSIIVFLFCISPQKGLVICFFFFLTFRELHLLLCYSWCFPILSSNGQEIVQRDNVFYTSHEILEKYSSLVAAGHGMRRLLNISLLMAFSSQFQFVKKGTNTVTAHFQDGDSSRLLVLNMGITALMGMKTSSWEKKSQYNC